MNFFSKQSAHPKIKIKVIGGHKHTGHGSAILIQENEFRTVLDCGADPSVNEQNQYLEKERTALAISEFSPDFLAISHFHYDHYGSIHETLETLKSQRKHWPVIVSSDLTFKLVQRYLNSRTLGFSLMHFLTERRKLKHRNRTEKIELIPNSHSVPGSCSILYRGAKNILYTSDFYDIDLPFSLPLIDLLIVDSTNALKEEKRDLKDEEKSRNNIIELIKKTLANPFKQVYIALFSTQLERAVWLHKNIEETTGTPPFISGSTLRRNLEVYKNPRSTRWHYRVTLMTGAWAQGGNHGLTDSALLRLSKKRDRYVRINPGDLVIISASIPLWSPRITREIQTMCIALKSQGAKVVVDVSAPDFWDRFFERKNVHTGGHGNMPEIAGLIKKIKPKKVLPFHASFKAREKVANFCVKQGIDAISLDETSSFIL